MSAGPRGRWLWLLPLGFSAYLLARLWPQRMGQPGDFFLYAVLARLGLQYPDGLPAVLPVLAYPVGQARSAFPEMFSEPLFRVVLVGLARLCGDPVRAVWLGIVGVAMANVWVPWLYFWRRYGFTRPLAVVVGWSVVALLPWWWFRLFVHWHLAWMPLLFGCLAVWFEFFVERRATPTWAVLVLHGLLLAQSAYYGVFVLVFVAGWCLLYAPELWRERRVGLAGGALCAGGVASAGVGASVGTPQWRALLWMGAGAGVGYALALAWALHAMGGWEAARAGMSSGSHADHGWAYVFSNRVRELIRGAPGSPSDWIAALFGPRYTHGLDAETFPAPLPKLAALVAGIAGVLWWRRRHRAAAEFCTQMGHSGVGNPVHEGVLHPDGALHQDAASQRDKTVRSPMSQPSSSPPTRHFVAWADSRATAFAWATVLIVLLTGMQEITWIKFHVLYPLFPFIRSYGRMYFALMIVLALCFARLAARWETEAGAPAGTAPGAAAPAPEPLAAPATAASAPRGDVLPNVAKQGDAHRARSRFAPKWGKPLAGVAWIAALGFDYGWDWRPNLYAEFPCQRLVDEITRAPLPFASSGDAATGCYPSPQHLYALTGAPALSGLREVASQDCTALQARLTRAGGEAWWWHQGTASDHESLRRCLGAREITVVARQAGLAAGTEDILSRVRF